MTLLSPWRLLLLAAPLGLLLAYVLVQWARRRYVVRFTSVELLSSVLPRRAGWQRHLGAAGLLASLALLVVGFARPARDERIARERGPILLTLDTSASMGATDVSPTRLEAAKKAASQFVDGIPTSIQVGLISFDRTARLLVSPTTDHTSVLDAIERLTLGPGTATASAINVALDSLTTTSDTSTSGTPTSTTAAGGTASRGSTAIVLMSDGTPTIGEGDQTPQESVAIESAAAQAAGIPIDTIAFGTADGMVDAGGRTVPVPADPQAMQAIASQTGGQSFTAESAGELESVYAKIGRTVSYDTEQREITAWFTGLALVLALVAGVAGLVWGQRLV